MMSVLRLFARAQVVAALWIGLSPAWAAADSPSAAQIIAQADAAERLGSAFLHMEQVITTSGGQRRTLVMRAWSVGNGDKQLTEYLAPADIKGQRLLMTEDGDNIWMYNPETRRTRKLGSHMKKRKVMGSDFTYEDQAGGKLAEKYSGRLLREEALAGVLCYVLELIPTPEGPSYEKVVAFVGKDDFITRRVDYFESGGKAPFKRLMLEDIRTVGDRRLAHRMTMRNLEDQTETINIIKRVQLGAKIPLSIFEARNLGK